jgi:integrase
VTIKAREETKRDRRIHRDEEQTLLAACLTMNAAEHKCVGPAMHDRIIGALETCCRQGEMLRIQNRHVDWPQHQIVIPGANAKDAENRRIPFDPQGRLAPILKRRAALGPHAFVFGSEEGDFQDSFKTAWESLLLLAYGHETKRVRPGFASIARSCGRSTCTGTTCGMKAPAASWRTASTSASSS